MTVTFNEYFVDLPTMLLVIKEILKQMKTNLNMKVCFSLQIKKTKNKRFLALNFSSLNERKLHFLRRAL